MPSRKKNGPTWGGVTYPADENEDGFRERCGKKRRKMKPEWMTIDVPRASTAICRRNFTDQGGDSDEEEALDDDLKPLGQTAVTRRIDLIEARAHGALMPVRPLSIENVALMEYNTSHEALSLYRANSASTNTMDPNTTTPGLDSMSEHPKSAGPVIDLNFMLCTRERSANSTRKEHEAKSQQRQPKSSERIQSSRHSLPAEMGHASRHADVLRYLKDACIECRVERGLMQEPRILLTDPLSALRSGRLGHPPGEKFSLQLVTGGLLLVTRRKQPNPEKPSRSKDLYTSKLPLSVRRGMGMKQLRPKDKIPKVKLCKSVSKAFTVRRQRNRDEHSTEQRSAIQDSPQSVTPNSSRAKSQNTVVLQTQQLEANRASGPTLTNSQSAATHEKPVQLEELINSERNDIGPTYVQVQTDIAANEFLSEPLIKQENEDDEWFTISESLPIFAEKQIKRETYEHRSEPTSLRDILDNYRRKAWPREGNGKPVLSRNIQGMGFTSHNYWIHLKAARRTQAPPDMGVCLSAM